MKIFGNRTASGAVSDFKRDPSSRFKRDSGLLFVVAIHPHRRAVRYSGEQTITFHPRSWVKCYSETLTIRVLDSKLNHVSILNNVFPAFGAKPAEVSGSG